MHLQSAERNGSARAVPIRVPLPLLGREVAAHVGRSRPASEPVRSFGQHGIVAGKEKPCGSRALRVGRFWYNAYSGSQGAPLAQLDRASGYEPEGREFESLRARHSVVRLPLLT